MHIHIVTVSSGWILQKIAERIATHNPLEDVTITVGHSANPAAINYYADLQNCYHRQKTKLDIAYFTHADRNSKEWLIALMNERNAWALDGIMSMNDRYTEMLIEIGYPKEKLITLTPGQTHDTFPLRKIKIGIVSRGDFEGYGQFFMQNFLSSYDCANFEFSFLGNGWEHLLPIAEAKGINIKLQGDIDYSVYPKFYQTVDYLLIPGLWTAGPMSMQEALSTGTPVIGANIGFVNYEFEADYVFEPNDVAGLSGIFDGLQAPLLKRREQVSFMNWSEFTVGLINFIKRMGENKI